MESLNGDGDGLRWGLRGDEAGLIRDGEACKGLGKAPVQLRA